MATNQRLILPGDRAEFRRDMDLEIKFSRTIKGILGQFFFTKDITADLKQGTDFLILSLNPVKVAVRLRNFKNIFKYSDQFTIRWSRPKGTKTEIDKIREGLVDYIFYGFVDEYKRNLIRYFIGDLKIFRKCNPKPFEIHWNNPPDSELAAFRISDLPSEFILHRYQPEVKQLTYWTGG